MRVYSTWAMHLWKDLGFVVLLMHKWLLTRMIPFIYLIQLLDIQNN